MVLMLFDWKFEGAELVMDWVVVASVLSTLVLLLIEIIRSIRDGKTHSKEHESLSKEHDGLSKEHGGLSKEHDRLISEHEKTHEVASRLYEMVSNIDKFVTVEAERRAASDRELSADQRDMQKQIDAIASMYKELETLRIENRELRQEMYSLKRDKQLLESKLDQTPYEHDFEQEMR